MFGLISESEAASSERENFVSRYDGSFVETRQCKTKN
jgi:hypothetical protein